jgi:predicted dehydrogenase
LLAAPDIEVVSICTPPASHVPLVEAAAAAGKHVLVEKPLAVTVADADRSIRACAAAGVHLGVVHQQRARAAVRALREVVRSGRIGRPLLGIATQAWFRTQGEIDGDPWRGSASAGGGVLLDQAVHVLDLLIWMLGEPAWVCGGTALLSRRMDAEDCAAAAIGFSSGAVGTLAATTAGNLGRDDSRLEIVGTLGGFLLEIRDYDNAEIVRLDLSGREGERARTSTRREVEALIESHGGIWRRGPRGMGAAILGAVAGHERGAHPFRSPRAYLRRLLDRKAQSQSGEREGHAAILQAMAEAARGKGAPLVTGADARSSLAAIEALQRSARSGCRMEVTGPPADPPAPCTDPPVP